MTAPRRPDLRRRFEVAVRRVIVAIARRRVERLERELAEGRAQLEAILAEQAGAQRPGAP